MKLTLFLLLVGFYLEMLDFLFWHLHGVVHLAGSFCGSNLWVIFMISIYCILIC